MGVISSSAFSVNALLDTFANFSISRIQITDTLTSPVYQTSRVPYKSMAEQVKQIAILNYAVKICTFLNVLVCLTSL